MEELFSLYRNWFRKIVPNVIDHTLNSKLINKKLIFQSSFLFMCNLYTAIKVDLNGSFLSHNLVF